MMEGSIKAESSGSVVGGVGTRGRGVEVSCVEMRCLRESNRHA